MSSIDKLSVRDEIDRFKNEFNGLCRSGKMNKESQVLFKGLFMVVDLMLTIFLEKKTKKNNKNSSKPSSQTDKDESAAGQPGLHSKGTPEKEMPANHSRVTESVSVTEVTFCECCGEDLTNIEAEGHERRSKIDIVFEKKIEHVDAQIKTCPNCESQLKGEFPKDMPGPLQYGVGLKAYVINLIIAQMVGLNRVQKLIKSMMNVVIAEATMLKFILRLYTALADWEVAATQQLLQAPTMHVDETSLRVSQKNHWIHVYSSGDVTLKFLHRKRGTEAIKANDIIPKYKGTIIHDCWQSYQSCTHCDHGLCGSHLLRELTFVVESNGYAWAKNMKRALQDACKMVSKRKRKKLSLKEYARLQKRYRNILTRGEKEMPTLLPKPKGKRGKMAKSDAHNLWERLKLYESAVLLFARNADVPFTNNRAERDLRMSKVKQKVSGCFRKEIYAKAYCRISSYLQTMTNKGYNPLVAIQMALKGKIPA